jgi:hypothetical protein
VIDALHRSILLKTIDQYSANKDSLLFIFGKAENIECVTSGLIYEVNAHPSISVVALSTNTADMLIGIKNKYG